MTADDDAVDDGALAEVQSAICHYYYTVIDYDYYNYDNESFTEQGGADTDQYTDNYTDQYTDQYTDHSSAAASAATYEHVTRVLEERLVVAICVFGLVGNLFNLLILIPKSVQCSLGRIEKFVNCGLIALTVSDLGFCLMVIPHAFVRRSECQVVPDSVSFCLVYLTYSNALINVFIMASTWLTVTLAIGRYLATCHPLRAREVIGLTSMKWSILAVCVLCLLFNVPRFWTFRIERAHCPPPSHSREPAHDPGQLVYFINLGALTTNVTLGSVYSWLYFVFEILIPLVLLVFSNAYLIRALRMSRVTRSTIRAGTSSSPSHYITMTLVAIVMMHIALVSPAEIINFVRHKIVVSQHRAHVYDLAVAAVNSLQAVNFSFNFLLYCLINASFRRSFVQIVCCRGTRHENRRGHHSPGSFSSTYTFRAQYNGTRTTLHSFKLTDMGRSPQCALTDMGKTLNVL